MTTFVDTSALYAVLDAGDPNHTEAARTFGALATTEPLVTHNYVLVESISLVQRRLGTDAVGTLVHDLLAPVDVAWVDVELHERALSAMAAARRRHVSLVDWTSFEVMRQRAIVSAFVFDADFAEQGFTTVPSASS